MLLHGLFGSGGNLGALARHLREAFQVLSLDLPGHGRSAWLPRYSLAEFAAVIADWLRRVFTRRISSAIRWEARWRWNSRSPFLNWCVR